jgi:hydroxymethylpyrimidine pyrophosphatase-like HAD family hydrolase
MHDRIHCDETGRDFAEYVSVWTRDLHVHPKLIDVRDWRLDGEIAFAAGIGSRDAVQRAHLALERDHPTALEMVSFQIRRAGENWALLARPHGCNKGAALARLADRLGVERENVAAVGDWYNDVTMLKWAGRSFAMGQAPEAVACMATDRLTATAMTGGGVAEAIDRWLAATV